MISKTNSNKHKNITQQHIKLTSSQSQAQGNVYKALSYQSFPLNSMSKSSGVVAPETQSVPIIQPTVQQIQPVVQQIQPAVQQVDAGKKYKFTPPIQPNFKFSGQPTNNDYILQHGSHVQQMMPVNTNRNETITIQVMRN